MSAQQSVLSSVGLDPATERQLVRRASQLCLRAEPHTDEPPCAAHLSEANRQLYGSPA